MSGRVTSKPPRRLNAGGCFQRWLVALAIQLLAFPLVGIEASLQQNLLLGAIFTAVSLARSYLLRRLFNRIATGAL